MRIILYICLILISGQITGQRVISPKLVEVDWKGIVYKKEWSVDFRLHENGAAIAYNTGKIKSYNKTNYYHIELGFTKDPREKSISKFTTRQTSGSYILGKVNNLINFRIGAGVKKYLSEKQKRKGLAVGYTYELGPSIAILKPYYLDLIIRTDDGTIPGYIISTEKYTEDNADLFLTPNSIDQKASFFTGFDDLSIQAGIQGKLGAHLAWGAFDKSVKAFETGLMFDLFTSKIPIMVETEEVKNKPYFVRLYLNLQLGLRNNR